MKTTEYPAQSFRALYQHKASNQPHLPSVLRRGHISILAEGAERAAMAVERAQAQPNHSQSRAASPRMACCLALGAAALLGGAVQAYAGDSTEPGPPEALIPYIIETADLGVIPAFTRDPRFTDQQMMEFIFGGEPIAPVPIPDSIWLLSSVILIAFGALKLWRKQS